MRTAIPALVTLGLLGGVTFGMYKIMTHGLHGDEEARKESIELLVGESLDLGAEAGEANQNITYLGVENSAYKFRFCESKDNCYTLNKNWTGEFMAGKHRMEAVHLETGKAYLRFHGGQR